MATSTGPARQDGCRLLVDARGIETAGIGRYIREVLRGLIADPRFAHVTLLGTPSVLARFVAEQESAEERIRIVSYPGSYYSAATQAAWLRHGRRYARGADVAFFPHYDTPLSRIPVPAVVTVHDLTHFKVPELFRPWQRAAGSVLLARAVRQAVRVITGSYAARDDLVERFPGIGARIDVVYHGVVPAFRLDAGAARNGAGKELEELRPFLLCVGNRKAHKNLGVAVEALALLIPERRDLKLVIVGRRYRGWEAVAQRAEELGVGGATIELEEVDDALLRSLYCNCEALLFPSLYEGFGLPVLEAMGCGAPVIASDRASVPEVVGDAGLVVDATRPEQFAAAVRRLWSEPGLRDSLVSRGFARAEQFDWGRTARATADVLLQAAVGEA